MYRVIKKREQWKCVNAVMYNWKNCGIRTLCYRASGNLVIIRNIYKNQQKGQMHVFAIHVLQNNDTNLTFLCHPVHNIC